MINRWCDTSRQLRYFGAEKEVAVLEYGDLDRFGEC
jgi:hypothetical protein